MKRIVKGVVLATVLGAATFGILAVEMQEATATTTRTFGIYRVGKNDGSCQTASAIKKVVATQDEAVEQTISFSTYGSNEYCDGYEITSDFTRYGGVSVVAGDVIHGAFGWLDSEPTNGNHSDTVYEVAFCHIRGCGSWPDCDYNDESNGKYRVATTGDVEDFCIYRADF